MRRKSKSNNNLISKDDFCYEEEVEENGICETPVTGNMVAQFSFSDNNLSSNEPMSKQPEPEVKKVQMFPWSPNPTLESTPSKAMEFKDNKTITPYPYGITPPVDGEYLDTRRSFSLRKSTIRMLNELKAADPDINIYLNSIVDKALRHYHEYIFKEKDSKS